MHNVSDAPLLRTCGSERVAAMQYRAAPMLDARSPSRLTIGVLALLMLGAAIVIQHAGHGTVFFYDEWDFITGRRGFSADSFLDGHNGHLSVVPVAVYKVMLQVFGLDAYWPYRLTLVLLHLVASGLLFVVLRRRVGDAAAVCGAALLLFLGSAADDLLWAFQIGFVGSMAAGLGMLVALDRRSRRGDLVAMVLLAVSLGCSSLGVSFLAIAVIEPAVQRDWRRLARIVLGPVALYLLWRAAYGDSDLMSGNLDDAPAYAFQMLAAATGGMTGLGGSVGPTLAVLALLGLGWAIARSAPSARLLAVLAGAVSLWGLTALARAQLADPGASRYLYASVVLLMLAGAELWPRGFELRGRALVVAAVATGIAVLGNLLPLNEKAGSLRANSENVKARLSALQLAGVAVPPDFRPAPEAAPQIQAGPYLAAVRDFGSPAETEQALASDQEPDRLVADVVLSQIVAPATRPVTVSGPLRGCTAFGAGSDVPLPAEGSIVLAGPRDGAPAQLLLRRFAAGTIVSALATLEPGGRLEVTTVPDDIEQSWAVRVTAPVRACSA